MKKSVFNTKNLLIALYIFVGFLGGFAFGLRLGNMEGSQRTTEIRNQMLDIKPYDASLRITDIEYNDISSAGVTISFSTYSSFDNLTCMWTIYPSDVFLCSTVQSIGEQHVVTIETYPEGGTLMLRILEGGFEDNRGSLWLYIDLPRPQESTVLPPPYIPTEKEGQ